MDKMSTELIFKKIAIIGYGVEGRSTHDYLKLIGAENVVIYDEKLDTFPEIISNKFEENDYTDIELVFRSPGVKYERIKKLIPHAEITSQTDYFFDNARGKKIIITGTKGKTTTATIIYELYSQLNKKVFLGGNVGNPLLSFIDKTDENSISVIELSSFQLQDFKGNADEVLILPIKIDHLDYHKSEKEYVESKLNSLKNLSDDGVAIIPQALIGKVKTKARVIGYSVGKQLQNGCFIKDEKLICINKKNRFKLELKELSRKYKIPIVNLVVAGAYIFHHDLKIDLSLVLERFSRPDFRIQKIVDKNGLRFFNDSASTNPISTIEAVEMMDDKFCLILGGSSKSLDYSELAQKLSSNEMLERIYIYGAVADEVKTSLEQNDFKKEILLKNDLREVVEDIFFNDGNFRIVLFSPASASFDQYESYKKRGEHFNRLVGLSK